MPKPARKTVFGAPLRAAAGRPGDRQAGREIAPVMNIGLRFVPQSQTQCEVWTHSPVVAAKYAGIKLVHGEFGNIGIETELSGAAAQGSDLHRRIAELLEQNRAPVALD